MSQERPEKFVNRLISIVEYNNEDFLVYSTYSDSILKSHFTLNVKGNVYQLN